MRVHKNLHRGDWSVTPKGGRVQHVDEWALTGVRFVVSAAGRARVLERKCRAVHAWADGEPVAVPADLSGLVQVTYNPFRSGTFDRCDGKGAVAGASMVVFTADGRCLCRLP